MMTAQQPALHPLYLSKQEVFLHAPDGGKVGDMENVAAACHRIEDFLY
jgi:hypothetical protein